MYHRIDDVADYIMGQDAHLLHAAKRLANKETSELMPAISKYPPHQANDPQHEVIDFLKHCKLLGDGPVEVFQTHGALVFVGEREMLKIKRNVRYDYMDFSSFEKRRAAVLREIEINPPYAPDLYLDAVTITREKDGSLMIDGEGEPLEMAVHMRAFSQRDLMSHHAAQGPIPRSELKAMADMVANYHAKAPVVASPDGTTKLADIIAQLNLAFTNFDHLFSAQQRTWWRTSAEISLWRNQLVLNQRARKGFVRRCHGDFHLANIVLWRGKPTPFDAIEFDEDLATIDTLYDLAFLLMDLDHVGQRQSANVVLNRYLWRSRAQRDFRALAAMPVFLSLRAGIRAMVTAHRSTAMEEPERGKDEALAKEYFEAACQYLEPIAPRLIAVGGLSGSGKSTLAALLAPEIGVAPGALHLRSDLERKALHKVEETYRLPSTEYTPETTAAVYDSLYQRAEWGLEAGQSVIVDAVFSRPDERAEIAEIAAKLGVPFLGLWLSAPGDTLKERVRDRKDDASDATVEVVEEQLKMDLGEVNWRPVATSGTVEGITETARALLYSNE